MIALGGTDCKFGWIDAFLRPSLLSLLPLDLQMSPAASAAARAAANAAAAPAGFYRGLWRSGAAPTTNDASADPTGTLGYAFTCPCAAAIRADRTDYELVLDPGGANGDSGVGQAVRVASFAGVLGEPEGVYPHVGVRCTWVLPATLHAVSASIGLFSSTPADSSSEDRPRVLVGPAVGAATDESQCYPANCDMLSGPTGGEVALPVRVVYYGGDIRTLGKRSAGGWRFLLNFSEANGGPPPDERRRGARAASSSAQWSDGNRTWGGPSERRDQGRSTLGKRALQRQQVENGGTLNPPAPAAGAKGRASAVVGGSDLGPDSLLLALSGGPGSEAPCSFQRGVGQAFLQLAAVTANITAMDGVWSGVSTADVEPGRGPMFMPLSSGACTDQDAVARFPVGAPGECATACVATTGCLYYSYATPDAQTVIAVSAAAAAATTAKKAAADAAAAAAAAEAATTPSAYQAAAAAAAVAELARQASVSAAADAIAPMVGDCRLFSACKLAPGGSKTVYGTYFLRGDMVGAECNSELSVRSRVLHLSVHCLHGRGSTASFDASSEGTKDPSVLMAAASARRSAQSGALSGILRSLPAADLPGLGLATSGGRCDALGGSGAPWCNATAAGRLVWYQTARVRWTASASDRVVGSEDYALFAFLPADSRGDGSPGVPDGERTELWLFLQPVTSGMPEPAAAFDPARRPSDVAAGARRLRLRPAKAIPVPLTTATTIISRAEAAAQCRAALNGLAGLAASGGAGCAGLISALLPVAPGRVPPAGRSVAVAARCDSPCVSAAVAAADAGERMCGEAWAAVPLMDGDLRVDADGTAVLLAGSAPVLDVLAYLTQVSCGTCWVRVRFRA
jgi:hypothetical protein